MSQTPCREKRGEAFKASIPLEKGTNVETPERRAKHVPPGWSGRVEPLFPCAGLLWLEGTNLELSYSSPRLRRANRCCWTGPAGAHRLSPAVIRRIEGWRTEASTSIDKILLGG